MASERTNRGVFIVKVSHSKIWLTETESVFQKRWLFGCDSCCRKVHKQLKESFRSVTSSHWHICPEQFQWGQNPENWIMEWLGGEKAQIIIFLQKNSCSAFAIFKGTISKLKFTSEWLIIGCLSENSSI